MVTTAMAVVMVMPVVMPMVVMPMMMPVSMRTTGLGRLSHEPQRQHDRRTGHNQETIHSVLPSKNATKKHSIKQCWPSWKGKARSVPARAKRTQGLFAQSLALKEVRKFGRENRRQCDDDCCALDTPRTAKLTIPHQFVTSRR
jgi:hypothetical protein